jgi:hypothetical protein
MEIADACEITQRLAIVSQGNPMRIVAALLLATATLTASIAPAYAIGAIAVNDEQGVSASEAGYGVGWGSTKNEAQRNAVKTCKDAGNDSCEVAVWFETCCAYAGDRVNYGIGYGDTKREAEKMALKDCPNCKLIVSDCQ